MRAISPQSGRSLTELLIVLAIMGIVAAMAGPSYRTMAARAQARSVTAEVASMLRSARQLAMARHERLLVRFDVSERIVTLRRADAEGVLEVYRYGEKGVVIEEPTAGPDLLFHSSGRSASATTIRIQDRQGRRTTITVSLTGRVVLS